MLERLHCCIRHLRLEMTHKTASHATPLTVDKETACCAPIGERQMVAAPLHLATGDNIAGFDG